jgi:hypothetical protein
MNYEKIEIQVADYLLGRLLAFVKNNAELESRIKNLREHVKIYDAKEKDYLDTIRQKDEEIKKLKAKKGIVK